MVMLQKTALAAVAAGSLAMAGTAWCAGVSDAEILIGSHLDLSGPVAAGMPQIRNGMQMRLDEANEAGGVHGRRFRLIVEDNAYQPGQAVHAVRKLVSKDRVFAIINSFGSGTNTAAVKTATGSGTIYFAPWGASSIVQAQAGGSPLLFTTLVNYDTTTAAAISWVIGNWNAKKLGLIYPVDALGELLRRSFRTAMGAAGLQPVAEASYRPGNRDFSAQVARMREVGAEVVMIAAATRETIGIMSEVKRIGWSEARFLAAAAARTSIVIALGKDAVEGLYGVGTWRMVHADSASGHARAWIEAYRRRFGLTPDENAAVAYSYTDWFVKGIREAGRNLTAETFIRAMGNVAQDDFSTYRRVGFRNNHIDPEVVRIEQVRGGRWVGASPDIVAGE